MTTKTTRGIPVDRHDQLIRDLGIRVKVFKSTLCPNMTSLETNDHDINCTICHHNMIDFCPTETIAMFQQQQLNEQFKVQGTFHIDELQATFLTGITLSTYTRVELLDFQEDFFELIQRQEGTNIDRLKYSATCVEGVFTVLNNIKTQYYFGVDFILTAEGDIQWTGTHKPTDRQIYSIYYKFRPVFRAIKAVHRDRYSQMNQRNRGDVIGVQIDNNRYVKLPETWILQRDYLIERPKNILYNPGD